MSEFRDPRLSCSAMLRLVQTSLCVRLIQAPVPTVKLYIEVHVSIHIFTGIMRMYMHTCYIYVHIHNTFI